jgi:Transposase IS66 family
MRWNSASTVSSHITLVALLETDDVRVLLNVAVTPKTCTPRHLFPAAYALNPHGSSHSRDDLGLFPWPSAFCPSRHLAGFAGLLQIDGYGAYNRWPIRAVTAVPVTLDACSTHLRRRFYELHAAGLSETATWTVQRVGDYGHRAGDPRPRCQRPRFSN